MDTQKYLVDKEAVCSECIPAQEYSGQKTDAWARNHAYETGHVVTIHETHDVYKKINPLNGE